MSRRTGLLLLCLVLAAACATAGGFRESNRRNLERLRPGMTREQVVAVMGTGQFTLPAGTEAGAVRIGKDEKNVSRVEIPVGGKRPVFYNPVRTELYKAGGHEYEVLLYYTRLVTDDGRLTDDELTPVVLRDGTMIGAGWEFWATEVDENGIPADLPEDGVPAGPGAAPDAAEPPPPPGD